MSEVKRILLVEDNPGDAFALQEIASEHTALEYGIDIVDRLSLAMEALTANHFDLVLLDLSLPDAFGVEAVEAVHGLVGDLPIIVLTGKQDDAVALAALRLGAQDCLTKGKVDASSFGKAVQYAIERKNAERVLHETNERLKVALEELREAQQALVQQERSTALGQLTSGIAHDFNNALTPILGFSEVLMRKPDSGRDSVEHLSRLINSAAADAVNVVQNLRRFAQGQVADPPSGGFDLNHAIQTAIELTQPKWDGDVSAIGTKVEVRSNLAASAPVNGSESDCRTAVTNLILNAVDAMPDGGLVTIESRQEAEFGVLEVRDSGTGMDEETLVRCGDPFFTTKGPSGTGLGLPMVVNMIERHGGVFEVESTKGVGTTFRIKLPLARETIAPPPSEAGPAQKSLKVLVADDEPLVLQLLSQFLKDDGHEVVEACDGRDALAKLILTQSTS